MTRVRLWRLVLALLVTVSAAAACGVPSTPIYRIGPPAGAGPTAANDGSHPNVLYFQRYGVLTPVVRYSSGAASVRQLFIWLREGPTPAQLSQGYIGDVPSTLEWLPAQAGDQAHTMRVNLGPGALSYIALGEITCTLNGITLGDGTSDSFGIIFPGAESPSWRSCGDFDVHARPAAEASIPPPSEQEATP